MDDNISLTPWKDAGWKTDADEWIERQVRGRGAQLCGPIEQPHMRPWSTVLRAPTTDGDVYLKSSYLPGQYEVALTADLHRRFPDCIVEVLAADTDRGWLLLADGGPRLRDIVRPTQTLDAWLPILRRYAELQMEMTGNANAMLLQGVPDRRPRTLATRLEAVLSDTTCVRIDQENGLTRSQYDRLLALLPQIRTACDLLETAGVPPTIHHGDLHDGNIFANGETFRLFDWADSSVSHPFFSLRTVAVSAEISLNLDEGTAPMDPLWDAYLEPWMDGGDRDTVWTAFEMAKRLWSLPTLFVWFDVVSRVSDEDLAPYAGAIPSLLAELLDSFESDGSSVPPH